MARRDHLDDRTDRDRDRTDPPDRRPSPHPSWVKFVAVGIIALVVMATVASALLS